MLYATVGLVTFAPAQFNLFLRTPEKHHGLFALVAAVGVAGTVGWTAGLCGAPAGGLSRRRAGRAGVYALLLGLGLALAYSFVASLAILPFESVAAEDVGQPSEVLLPLVLPENLRELVRHEGNRQAVVDRYKPGGVEFELRGHEGYLFLTKAGLALLYGLAFASLGAAGGLAVRAMALVPESGALDRPAVGGPVILPSLPADGSRPVAFISHASEDREEAAAVCAQLEKSGIPCWIAPRNIAAGTDWSEAISEGIEGCPVFLVLLSKAASDSKYVVSEVGQAFSEGKLIVPLRLERITPCRAIAFRLRNLHSPTLGRPPDEQVLAEVCTIIKRHLSARNRPAPDTIPAPAIPPRPATG